MNPQAKLFRRLAITFIRLNNQQLKCMWVASAIYMGTTAQHNFNNEVRASVSLDFMALYKCCYYYYYY